MSCFGLRGSLAKLGFFMLHVARVQYAGKTKIVGEHLCVCLKENKPGLGLGIS